MVVFLSKKKKVNVKNLNKLYQKPFPDDLTAFTFNYWVFMQVCT